MQRQFVYPKVIESGPDSQRGAGGSRRLTQRELVAASLIRVPPRRDGSAPNAKR